MSPDKSDDTRTRDSDFAALWSSDGVTRSSSSTLQQQARTAAGRAEATAAPILEDQARNFANVARPGALTGISLGAIRGTYIGIAVFAFIGALVTGSGFTFRPSAATLVNGRGQPVSRVRALCRATITWSPIVAVAIA